MLEVEADLVEAFLGDKVFAFRAEVTTVDNSVHEFIGGGAQVATGFNTADAFEAEGVPDTDGGYVCFVHKVEHAVAVILERGKGVSKMSQEEIDAFQRMMNNERSNHLANRRKSIILFCKNTHQLRRPFQISLPH